MQGGGTDLDYSMGYIAEEQLSPSRLSLRLKKEIAGGLEAVMLQHTGMEQVTYNVAHVCCMPESKSHRLLCMLLECWCSQEFLEVSPVHVST